MASRGGQRPRRGGGPRRGPPRGGPRRPYRRPQRDYPEIERLGREEVECESKTIVIEFCCNNQGQFMQIYEADSKQRSRINMNMESANQMMAGINGLLKDLDNILKVPASENAPLATCDPIVQGKRNYFVDIRENERGKFVKVKLEVRSNPIIYVAFPLDNFQEFTTKFSGLYTRHYNPQDNDTSPTSPSNLPNSREVRAGGKSFFFDVEKNDRGVFVRLTERVRNGGKRTYVNIPNSCWPQMAEVFTQLGQEVPYEEASGGSGSEDN